MPTTVAPSRLVLALPTLGQGGAERVLIAVGNELAARGIDVTLAVLGDRGEAGVASEIDPSVRFVALGTTRPLAAAHALAKLFALVSADAVLASLVGANAAAVAAARIGPRHPRVVVREANTISVALRYRSPLERIVAGAVARAAYPRADAIVAPSEAAADDLARFLDVPRARIEAIPNPAFVPRTRSSAKLTHPFALDASPLVVAAGRLVPKKGFDVLLRAIAAARLRPRVVILGEGPERARLEALAVDREMTDRVAMPGFVADPIAWLERADLFALSSFAEGMPNVLLQALACGCPAVATDCPSGPREILGDGTGALVPVGDAVALAAAIDRALDEGRAVGSAKARARAGDFALSRIASAYARVLGLDEH